jgi:hypothetical protein
MLGRVAILLLVIPSLAIAQTTTTNCTTYYWGSTQCVSNTPQQSGGMNWGLMTTRPATDPGQSFMNGWEQGQRMRAQMEAQRAAQAQQQAAEEAQAIAEAEQRGRALAQQQRQTAAQMVISGDCKGAEQYALSQSNLELAKQVKDYCSSK